MKTRRSAAAVPAQSSLRLRVQRGARVSAPAPARVPAPIGTRQLIDFPGGASLRIPHKAKGQVSRLWTDTAELVSQARINASKHFSRSWKNASELLSSAGMHAKVQISRSWKYLRTQQVAHASSKRLQVAETVSLGEKRFVAVIQVDGREFLVGGGATNVALLAQLDARQSFDSLLAETVTVPKKRPARRTKKPIATPTAEQVGGQM
jgi:hypothetical protein